MQRDSTIGHRGTAAVLGCLCLLLAACGSEDEPAATGTATGICAPVEFSVENVPPTDNPFDPAQMDVTAEFVAPDGTALTMPAFFAQPFARALDDGREVLSAQGAPGWRVRLAPTAPGHWRWRARIQRGGGAAQYSPSASFDCDVDPSSHGFLRRSDEDRQQLAWDDGTGYVAIGENLGWYDARGTFAYDDWLAKLAAHGATWIRVWMPSWAFGLEWIERGADGVVVQSSLGNYSARLDRAWQLDHVIEAARRRGMVVMLSIQNHGAFSLTANSEWDDNPYNRSNGGPLGRPHEFYTDPAARQLFERRLRYIVARWGYAPNVIWELWNEVDLADAEPVSDVVAWHDHMANTLLDLDPYDHLITTSIADSIAVAEWHPLWALPQIDLVQAHVYGIGDAAPLNFTTAVPRVSARLRTLGKPLLLAEAGVDFRGPADTLRADPTHQGLHELIWSGLFSGGIGTGMTWWWDNLIDPYDQYGQLDAIHALIVGVAWDQERFVLDGAAGRGGADAPAVQVFPLRGAYTMLVWVRNANHWWSHPDTSMLRGVMLDVNGLADGTWRSRWMDPQSGVFGAAVDVAVQGGHARLEVPPFASEIALRLEIWGKGQSSAMSR